MSELDFIQGFADACEYCRIRRGNWHEDVCNRKCPACCYSECCDYCPEPEVAA